MVKVYVWRFFNAIFRRTRSRVRKNNAFLHRAAKEGKQPELVFTVSICDILAKQCDPTEISKIKG